MTVTFSSGPGLGWPAAVQALFHDVRDWTLAFQNFPPKHGVPMPASATYSLARIFFEAGILLTPAVSALPYPPWFALFRYAHAFTGTQPNLALPIGSEDLDPRLLGVLAEELAVGVTGALARDLWTVQHLDDVEGLIRKNQVERLAPPPDPDFADARPDYLGLTVANEAVFFESKGATGAPHKLKAARAKGKKQVNNVRSLLHPHRATASRVVVSTQLPIKGKNKSSRATTFLDDPVVPPRPETAAAGPRDLLVRRAYAKILSLAGLEDIAALLILRRPLPAWLLEAELIQVRGRPFAVAGPFPLGGAVSFDLPVWKTLCTIGQGDLLGALAGVLANYPHDGRELTAAPAEEAQQGDGVPAIVLNNGAALVVLIDWRFRLLLRQRRVEAEF